MDLVDLSHPIRDGMVTYPGLPGPVIGSHLSFQESVGHYAPGTEFSIGSIAMVTNTGTYLDTAAHRHRDGHDLSGLPLERCAHLPTRVVAVEGTRIGPDDLPDDVEGQAILLRTGWDGHWGTERYTDPVHPHLTEEGAHHLAGRGAVLVGIDSVNVDDTTGGSRPAHTVLLGADVPIVEHLTGLDRLPPVGAFFTAVPPMIIGLATFTVRAFALIP